MNCIEEKIADYMEYLKKNGYSVSIHIKGISLSEKLIPYGIHSNPYCLTVKSKKEAWDKCLLCQKKVARKCEKGEVFFGMCYAGVCEYVFPAGKEGFISVSGYFKSEDKAEKCIENLKNTYGFNENILKKAYYKHLKKEILSESEVKTLIYPLCAMTELMMSEENSEADRSETDTNADYIYAHAVLYIENNYREKITVEDLSRYCHCSRSYLSHIFKKRSGKSINSYANEIRLVKSEKLLSETKLQITEISQRLGFSDSNYFTKLFRERFGCSPIIYRKNKFYIKEGI